MNTVRTNTNISLDISNIVPERGAPSDEFVVSYDANNTPLSYYGDNRWDLTNAHLRDEVTYVNFELWPTATMAAFQLNLISEAKLLLFNIIWRRKSVPLAASTIGRYSTFIRTLLNFCLDYRIHLTDFFGDSKFINLYLLETKAASLKKILATIRLFNILGNEVTGFHVIKDTNNIHLKLFREMENSLSEQHPPLPSRIYLNLINLLKYKIASFEKVSIELLDTAKLFCTTDLYKCLSYKKISYSTGNIEVPNSLIGEFSDDLLTFLIEMNIYRLQQRQILKVLTHLQIYFKVMVHTFTGMRSSETKHLSFYCLSSQEIDGQEYTLIHGSETKSNSNVLNNCFWVSNELGKRAIFAAQAIAKCIHGEQGENLAPGTLLVKYDSPDLFPNPQLLTRRRVNKDSIKFRKELPAPLILSNHPELFQFDGLLINNEDIKELELIDSNRAWRSEHEFQIGMHWPLRTHQLRRSLALFGTRSGLSTADLAIELQHMTLGMSEYYGKGSEHAVDILNTNPYHMCSVYQSLYAESEAISFLKNVILSDEPSYGGYGYWLHNNLHEYGKEFSKPDRVSVMKKFERGEMSYRETYLGGCNKVGPCDVQAMRSVFSCVQCGSATLKPSKITRAISIVQARLNKLEEGSIEWKAMTNSLNDLSSAQQQINKMEQKNA